MAESHVTNLSPITSQYFGPSSNQVEHTQIHALADDGNGGVWVGTEGGLDHVSRFRPNIEHTELVQHGVLSLLRDRQANLWLGSTHGLLKMTRGERQVKPVALALPNEVAIISLLETQDGRLWLGTRKHGAFVYDVQRNTLQAVQESFAPDSLLATEQITAMVEVRPGVVWLATFGHGIVVFDTRSGQSKRLKHDPSLPTNLANNIVWTILRDRAGLIWVGTAHGLSMHDPAQDAIVTILGAAQRQHGISGTDVFSIMPMPDERFWIGLDTNGVDILQADQMRVASLRSDAKMPRSALPKDDVFSMIAVPDGQVFLATGRGVYVTDAQARSGPTRRVARARPAGAHRYS